MRLGLVVVLAAACGRIGFDPDVTCLAGLCCGSGVCTPGCSGNEPSCEATCGDGRCDGTLGETCASCPADCATLVATCGNGWCDIGETPDTCPVDCGPAAWPWAQEEAALFALVEQARAAGTQCPGGGTAATSSLAIDPQVQPIVHAWAWAEASGELMPGTGVTCNGGSLFPLLAQKTTITFDKSLSLAGPSNVQGAFDYWIHDTQACSWLMGAYSLAGVAVAHDALDAYVFTLQ